MSGVSVVAGGQPSKQLQIHLTPEAGAEKQPANLWFPGSHTKPRGSIFTQVYAEVTVSERHPTPMACRKAENILH